jgi:lactate dehydrogenase-like 2-hydroxyacid dehydrogenase
LILEALAEALTDGRIAACVLDGAEAGFASSAIRRCTIWTTSIITPRIGSHTREARLNAPAGMWHIASMRR